MCHRHRHQKKKRKMKERKQQKLFVLRMLNIESNNQIQNESNRRAITTEQKQENAKEKKESRSFNSSSHKICVFNVLIV